MVPTPETQSRFSIDEQRAEVEVVLASAAFLRAPRHSKLLKYLTDKYFAGQSKDVKEYTIATEVLGRGSDFDQARDAIVRVEMHRLRKKLKDFYESEGAGHAIEILINPGQYIPCFVERGTVSNCSPASNPPVKEEELTRAPAFEHNAPKAWLWKEIGLAAAMTLICAAGLVALRKETRTTTADSSFTNTRSGGIFPALGPEDGVRILCGFAKDRYIDREGKVWGRDAYYSGGYTDARPRQYFARTSDPVIFETLRVGDFAYEIPVNPGKYELWLYFAETAYGPATTTGGGENSRVFNVQLNDQPLLKEFDITSDAGGANIADIRRFRDVMPAADGKVHLSFKSIRGHPILNAIQLLPMAGDKLAPIRIVAQVNSYTDTSGGIWPPDTYFQGGQLSTHKDVVKGTRDVDLYAGERYGNFSYAIPVDTRGTYTVNLHMAETYWGPNSPAEKGGIGTRVFDVYCNGVALLRKFDLYKEYGPFQAVKKTFRGLQPNAQGKLILSFVPIENYASVYAIEVLEE